ncbi:MAG TPA: hypothetical protein DIU07_12860 [Rhodobacteraceae bacterium]|nr:hypothetical protein [Paracoccaceae bacterium]
MPNPIAYLVLFSWPLVAWIMYKRMPLERAFVWTIIGGYLLLPPRTEVDLPLLPPIDKLVIANLSAFFLTIFVAKVKIAFLPRSGLAKILLIAFVFMTVPTILTNGDTIIIDAPFMEVGPFEAAIRVIPGLVPREVISFSGALVLIHALPFLTARTVLASETGRRELLRALMIGGLIYTIPAVFEIRFSPQLNIWIYGFFQHDFIQMIRGSTYRPIVFLPHALWLAFFFVSAALATASLARVQPKGTRHKYIYALLWLMLVVIASKSMASATYMLLLVPAIFLFSEAGRMRIGLIFVVLALAYPALRNAGIIPLDDIIGFINQISGDRAQSLEFRFENEEILLQHANERRLFGWGGWGRNLVFSEWDGSQAAVTDGRWIFIFGTYGIFGFIAEFGLLAVPVFLIWLRRKRLGEGDNLTHTGTLALMLGITMFDLLLNAAIVPYIWLIAGALIAAAEKSVAVAQKAPEVHQSVLDIKPVKDEGPRTVI